MALSPNHNKRLGCYYFLTFYPADLALLERVGFSFEFETKKIITQVSRRLKSLIINDFGNKIIRNEENGLIKHYVDQKLIEISEKNMAVEIENGGYFIIDHQKHLHKELYTISHSELIISFETTLDQNNYKFAQDALIHFTNSYKIVSDDVFTLSQDKTHFYSKIYKYCFHEYTEEELILTEEELILTEEERLKKPRSLQFAFHQFTIPFWNTQGKRHAKSPDEISKNLKEYFENKKQPNSLSEFILKSSEELHVHKNYKYSLIESWTALEIAIVSYVTAYKLKKGISKNKIKDYERDIGVAYLINIELPLIHPTNDQIFKDLLSRIDAIRKLRNNVIHENKSVSETDATTAITTLIEFLNYIGYKKY